MATSLNLRRALSHGRLGELAALYFAFVMVACGTDPVGQSGAVGGHAGQDQGGQNQGGQAQGGNSAGAAGQDLGTPLLEQSPRITHDCSVSRPISMLGISPWSGGVLIPGLGGPILVRGEGTSFIDERGPGDTLVVSGIDAQGTLGSPSNVTDFMPGWAFGHNASTTAGVTTLVWGQQDLQDVMTYRLTKLDAAGAVLVPPQAVGAISGKLGEPMLAPSANGFALFYDKYLNNDHALAVALLDPKGSVVGSPRVLLATNYPAYVSGLVRTSEGFLAAYTTSPLDGSEGGTYLVHLDSEGIPSGSPQLLGSAGGVEFLVRGDRIFAAWSEIQGGWSNQTIASTLRIGRFDATGNRLAPDRRLQGPVEDQDVDYPHWIDFGDDVGLLWSKGSVIYYCAGCMPDNHLEFVILDGNDLAPKSQMLTLPNLVTAGGLTDSMTAPIGEELLVVSSATYHTSAEGASATIHCVTKE